MKFKRRRVGGVAVVGGQVHRTQAPSEEMVIHCRVLSRGDTRAELYLNRIPVATLLREDHRDQGWRLEAQTGGTRIIQARDDGGEAESDGKERTGGIKVRVNRIC